MPQLRRPSPTGSNRPSSGWAASGAPSASSGRHPACTPPPSATRAAAESSRTMFQGELARAGYGEISTEIAEAGPFYYAEPYHQQYLAKNPMGYCGLGGTGVACPVGLVSSE